MSTNFQNEIPNSRINIELSIKGSESGVKTELPLKLLFLGDYSGKKNTQEISKRKRIPVNKNNFDNVLKHLEPKVDITVSNKIKNNGSTLRASIPIRSLESFQPLSIVREVPQLNNLLAMRNLLKDFRSHLLDNSIFRKELEKIAKDRERAQELKAELNQITEYQLEDGEAL